MNRFLYLKLTLACFLLIPFITFAQNTCFPDGIGFFSQEEVDDFAINYPDCTEIGGFVIIDGPDIVNLQGLSAITSIGGYLSVLAEA